MSKSKLVISVFAEDRPLLIQAVSDCVLQHDGNWLESSLSRLCGQFAGLVHIDVDEARRADLLHSLAQLEQQGIRVTEHSADGVVEEDDSVNAVEILVEANDRPGIIGEITQVLGLAGINIESLETGCESASMAGYTLFRAHMLLAMPDAMSEDDLDAIFASVSDDLMISILQD